MVMMSDKPQVKATVSLGSGIVNGAKIVYNPSKWALGFSSTLKDIIPYHHQQQQQEQDPTNKKSKGHGFLKIRKRWRKRSMPTTPSVSSVSESSVVDPVSESRLVPTTTTQTRDRGLPHFTIDSCTDEELLGGEMNLLDRSIELRGVKSMIEQMSEAEKLNLTDPRMVIRHFRAEKGDVDKAMRSLRAALEWRRDYGVDTLRTCVHSEANPELKEMIRRESKNGKLFVRGTTKEGRALVYMNAMKNETPEAEQDNMRQLVWSMEKASMVTHHHSKGQLDKYCLLIDCNNYKLSKSPSMSASKFTLDVLQKHYPERMYRAYVLNAPVAFRFFWNLIKNFIDPVTKSKIVFVSPGTPGLEQLYEDVGPEQAEKLEPCAFGKKPVRPFDVDEYLSLPMHISFDE